MANTVLGKVCPVPRGDYSATETYYALDIVGYQGGSYLAMKEVTGVTPSNDQTNWMQLSGPGLPGTDGVTFTPSVSEAGEISWTNDGDRGNPDPVNIMGPPGAAAGFGEVSATVDDTTGTPSVDVQTSGPDTAKNFTFAFAGLKGNPGETPDIEVGTVTTLEPGQDATADITGTTPNLTLSLGIPKGQPGTSVSRIQRTSGTGAAGTTDTYTMYDSNDEEIGTFTVYNGANGAGAGDFMADGSVPMTGALNMGGNRVTNVGAPTAATDAVRQSDLQALSDEIDHILDGTTPVTVPVATEAKAGVVKPGEGLAVTTDGTLNVEGFVPETRTVNGKALNQNISLTASDVGADPAGTAASAVSAHNASEDAHEALFAGKQDKLAGAAGQVVGFDSSGNAQAQAAPDPLPSGGTAGQLLTKTETGEEWANKPSYTADEVGARPSTWTPTASEVGAVPTSRTVNGKALSADITLSAADVSARPETWTPTASDVGAVPTSRTVNGKALSSNITLTADDVNAASLPTSTTVTLTTSGWSSNTQTVTVSGVSADETAQLIMPVPALASQSAYYEAGILVTGQAANSLTFTCSTVPSSNLTVYVVMQEVS